MSETDLEKNVKEGGGAHKEYFKEFIYILNSIPPNIFLSSISEYYLQLDNFVLLNEFESTFIAKLSRNSYIHRVYDC